MADVTPSMANEHINSTVRHQCDCFSSGQLRKAQVSGATVRMPTQSAIHHTKKVLIIESVEFQAAIGATIAALAIGASMATISNRLISGNLSSEKVGSACQRRYIAPSTASTVLAVVMANENPNDLPLKIVSDTMFANIPLAIK